MATCLDAHSASATRAMKYSFNFNPLNGYRIYFLVAAQLAAYYQPDCPFIAQE